MTFNFCAPSLWIASAFRADALRRLAFLRAVHGDIHAVDQFFRQRHVEGPVEDDLVFLLDFVARVGELQGQARRRWSAAAAPRCPDPTAQRETRAGNPPGNRSNTVSRWRGSVRVERKPGGLLSITYTDRCTCTAR